jgi:glycosyltransferase involved in cell wall biosynthesis
MAALKVLHVEDSDYSDPRIINAATTGRKAGYDTYFCGVNSGLNVTTDVFKEIRWISFSAKSRVAKRFIPFIERYWNLYPYPKHAIWVEKQMKQVIDAIRPDIIHAHNIFAAHYASAFGIPLVLDDHELYSVYVRARYEDATAKARMEANVMEKRWSEWERTLGEHHPVITVSKEIAKHHERYCKHVFVVPNYPRQGMIKLESFGKASKGELCSVYIGADSPENPTPVRNIAGLYDIFGKECGTLVRIGVSSPNTSSVKSFGFVPMDEAYKIMRKCHIGLLPWRRHWFHRYCNPNKVYEYAHCGLWLITIDDVPPVLRDFGDLCDKMQSYDELADLLSHYNAHPDELNEKRLRSLRHVQANLIWEKEEQKILEAYRVA